MSFVDFFRNLFKRNKGIVKETRNEVGNVTAEDLEKEQEIIDEKYQLDGLTDDVLDAQVALNTKRSELNIPDENNLVDGYSQ